MSDFTIPDVTQGNPGKRTQPATSARDLHDPYVETGGPTSFLTPEQRHREVDKYQMRVLAAEAAYYAALGQVGLEEALREDADVDMFTSIVIDALGIVASTGLKLAAKAVRGSNLGIGFLGPQQQHSAKEGDESAVSLVFKGAIDAGKKAAKSMARDGTEFDRDKAAASGLLQQLGANAALSFQHLREDPPGMLGDADLIMATESMDAAMGHNMVKYAAELRAKLARFRRSTASKVGRTDRVIHGEQPDEIAARGNAWDALRKTTDFAIRDTKLVLQVYADGTPSDLMYYVRDYDVPFNPGGEHDPSVDLDMYAEGTWHASHRVDAEFAEAAIARNRDAWGSDYETKTMSARADGPAVYTDPKTRPALPAHKPMPVYPRVPTTPRHFK